MIRLGTRRLIQPITYSSVRSARSTSFLRRSFSLTPTDLSRTISSSHTMAATPMDKSLQVGAAAWNAVAEKYTQEATSVTGFQALHAVEETLKRLKASSSAKKFSIADIACGSGAVAFNVATKYANEIENVVASDYSDKMVEILNRRYDEAKKSGAVVAPLRTVVADAQDLSAIPSNSVDVTFCIFGIMFIPDPKKAVAEMARITKPGGLISFMSWTEASHSQYHGLHAAITKHLAAKTAEEAAKAGTPAPTPVAPPASSAQTLTFPFNQTKHYQALFDELNLKTELLTTHQEVSRQYDNAAEFWNAMHGITPIGTRSGVSPQQSKWAIEFLSSIWGEFSPFSYTTNAVFAVARKQ